MHLASSYNPNPLPITLVITLTLTPAPRPNPSLILNLAVYLLTLALSRSDARTPARLRHVRAAQRGHPPQDPTLRIGQGWLG